jgi:hypothetical protein
LRLKLAVTVAGNVEHQIAQRFGLDCAFRIVVTPYSVLW